MEFDRLEQAWRSDANTPTDETQALLKEQLMHTLRSRRRTDVLLAGIPLVTLTLFTALALVTGSLWGKPMWGTWWQWDARMTSVLVLFLFYLGYLALRSALEDEQKAARAAAILALVGLINLPVVKFSVEWWNTLHQGSSTLFAAPENRLPAVYLWPWALMTLAYLSAFGSLWLVRIRALVWRRKARALALRLAER